MKLYDALVYLHDSGHGADSASIYLLNGPGIMLPIDDALSEQGWLAGRAAEWFDNEVLYEPYIDGGGRWVFCVGYPNGEHPAPSWDGFFAPGELPVVHDEWDALDGRIRPDEANPHYPPRSW